MKKRIKSLISLVFVLTLLLSSALTCLAAEPRSLVSTTGFKPRTLTIYPVATTSSGDKIYLSNLRFSPQKMGTDTDNNYVTFKGPEYEYLDQVKSAIESNGATLTGWYLTLTGYVNGTKSGMPGKPDSAKYLTYKLAEEQQVNELTVRTGDTVKIEIEYNTPATAVNNVYTIKATGNLHYYSNSFSGIDYSNLKSISWKFSVNLKPLKK